MNDRHRRRESLKRRCAAFRRAIWILVASCLLSLLDGGASARAEIVLMLPGSGQNVSAAVVEQARSLVMEQLAARCMGCRVLAGAGAPTAIPMRPTAGIAFAQQLGAQATVALNVAHDAKAVPAVTVLTLTAYAFAPCLFPLGKPVQVHRRIAEGPESLRVLAGELVLSLLLAAGIPLEQLSPSNGPAGAHRDSPPRRFFFGADVGVNVLFGVPAGNALPLPRLGLFAMYLRSASMVDLRAESGGDTPDHSVASVGLGVYSRQGERWFVGGVARWGRQHAGGRGAFGGVVQPVIGMLYPIGDWPIARLDLGYAVALFRERELDRLIPGSGDAHRAHGPTLTLGVAF